MRQSVTEMADEQRTRPRDKVLAVRDLVVSFGPFDVLKGLNLDVYRGEILGFVGGSGSGKSVLMRTILGLNEKQAGEIRIFDIIDDEADDETRLSIDQKIGVLFQHGALFSSLTVKERFQ